MAGKLGKKGKPSLQTNAAAEPEGIEKELLDALKEPAQKENEAWAGYVTRLILAFDKMSNDDYEALSDEAKEWLEKAVDAHNNKDVGSAPKFNGEAAEAPAAAAAPEPAPAKAEKAAKPEKVEKAAKPEKVEKAAKPEKAEKAAKPEKPAKEKKERAINGSPSSVARQIVCEKLGEISFDDLKKEMKARKLDITDGQLGGVHNVTCRVIRVLQHVGKL